MELRCKKASSKNLGSERSGKEEDWDVNVRKWLVVMKRKNTGKEKQHVMKTMKVREEMMDRTCASWRRGERERNRRERTCQRIDNEECGRRRNDC